MQSWKPLLAILPTGLLLGLVGGQASRPEMVIKQDRPWPQSLRESVSEAETRQPAYAERGIDVYARGYSYRPDLDYDAYAWPDQGDYSGALLALADSRHAPLHGDETPGFDGDSGMPRDRRAVDGLARTQAEQLAARIEESDARADGPATAEVAAAGRPAFVLPPVPPPLDSAGQVPPPDAAHEADDDL